MGSNKRRIYWIDAAKFMAIIGVMIDHTNGLLYKNQDIAWFSYYSVSLFILLMGITGYWSYRKNNGSIIKKVGSGCWKVLRPYIIATFVYDVLSNGEFHFDSFLDQIVHFNASAPFYYILLYLQLLFLMPILYYVLDYAKNHRFGVLIELVCLFVVLVISVWTTNNTNILDVYGGGGKLFGGTYLILLYLGMIIGKYYDKFSFNNRIVVIILFVLSFTLTIMWWRFISVDNRHIDTYVPYGWGFNPPSISFGVYAILMACTICLLEGVLINSVKLYRLFSFVSVLGKHTLYIFLYHRLFLDRLLPAFFSKSEVIIANKMIMRIVYFACMIGGSIAIEIIFESIHSFLKKVYTAKQEE